jgi:hypothetical protein
MASLELRPNRLVIAAWAFAGVISLVVGWIVWAEGGWPISIAAAALALLSILLIVRARLILTPEGFHVRYLWDGPVVPWNAVSGFVPDQGLQGAVWLRRDAPPMPRTKWQLTKAMFAVGRQNLLLFGSSRREMVATLDRWLSRYGDAEVRAEPGAITVDADELLRNNPKLHARLMNSLRREEPGEPVDLDELNRIVRDLESGSTTPPQS